MSSAQPSSEGATGSPPVKAAEDLVDTTYGSVSDLASALRRASEAHGQHERRTGEEDPNWPDWYALYMVRERSGRELPT